MNRSFGSRGKGDLFVARLKPGDATVHSSMVLGGSRDEKLTGIAIADKIVFVTGYTESADFPVMRPLQARLGGRSDARSLRPCKTLSLLRLARISVDLATIPLGELLWTQREIPSWRVSRSRMICLLQRMLFRNGAAGKQMHS